jgi:hypothetical protein
MQRGGQPREAAPRRRPGGPGTRRSVPRRRRWLSWWARESYRRGYRQGLSTRCPLPVARCPLPVGWSPLVEEGRPASVRPFGPKSAREPAGWAGWGSCPFPVARFPCPDGHGGAGVPARGGGPTGVCSALRAEVGPGASRVGRVGVVPVSRLPLPVPGPGDDGHGGAGVPARGGGPTGVCSALRAEVGPGTSRVGRVGVEPTTFGLKARCSAN